MTTKKGGKASFCLSVNLSIRCMFILLLIWLLICMYNLSVFRLSISVHSSLYNVICLSVCLFVHLSLSLSECPGLHFSSVCLIVCLHVCLPLRISANCCLALILLVYQFCSVCLSDSGQSIFLKLLFSLNLSVIFLHIRLFVFLFLCEVLSSLLLSVCLFHPSSR